MRKYSRGDIFKENYGGVLKNLQVGVNEASLTITSNEIQ